MVSLFSSTDTGVKANVTQEEFVAFHTIDRQLYTRLVVSLGRDPSQCIHVMAFIMWLERTKRNFQLVANLLPWPNSLLNDLAEEVVLSLNCIESSEFPYSPDKVLPLLHNLSCGSLTLQNLHESRIAIIHDVTKILSEVCIRAFTDIMKQVQHERAMKHLHPSIPNFFGPIPNHPMAPVFYYAAPPVGIAFVPQPIPVPIVAQWQPPNFGSWVPSSSVNPHDVNGGTDINEEFKDILAKLEISGAALAREMKDSPADERTVFLTFSKGYPISESELREYFARAHGDIIETLHMQDVPPTEQPLFARMVVRTEAMKMVDSFLQGTARIKFAINGKHVWARRYVRKGNKSPMETVPDTSAPPA